MVAIVDLTIKIKAARKAGISPVIIIKEPEAAALYTLHYLKDKALNVGDAVVLCDAGGGTVDLISYEITQFNPLQLKELVPGKGGLAGSLMLNKRFEALVKDIVGEEQLIKLRGQKGFRLAMEQFDQTIKTTYTGKRDEEFFVNFPQADLKDVPESILTSNCLKLTGEMVKEIFDPLLDNVNQLVDEQINMIRLKRMSEQHPKANAIKAVFLVGGFGSSLYLRDYLQEQRPDIQVIQPHDAWAAILKGAVMSQLPEKAVITSTVATNHYGVSALYTYRETEHAGQTKLWDKYEKLWRR
ncbi:MAG: hypothetical protein M1814_000494 [Vezdaea aestivalis]|nr:MAG: hypothetical protein M1814_000494 [Vezdaea aestivalis]